MRQLQAADSGDAFNCFKLSFSGEAGYLTAACVPNYHVCCCVICFVVGTLQVKLHEWCVRSGMNFMLITTVLAPCMTVSWLLAKK